MKECEDLGTVVRKCYGTENCNERESSDGEFAVIGTATNEPTYQLVAKDGHVYCWLQSLTRPATSEETIGYWRDRALKAEANK